MTQVKTTPPMEYRTSGFLPILYATSGCSLFLSTFVSNYAGMGLAILTLLLAGLTLEDVNPRSRNWVCAISICGFLVGVATMTMRVVTTTH